MRNLHTKTKCLFLQLLLIFSSVYCCQAQIQSYHKTVYGVSCRLNKGILNIYVLKDDIVEVKYTILNKMAVKQSLVVLPVTSYETNFRLADNGNDIVITTRKLKVRVNRSSLAITYTDLQNNIIVYRPDACRIYKWSVKPIGLEQPMGCKRQWVR